jgi:hypothetical protein
LPVGVGVNEYSIGATSWEKGLPTSRFFDLNNDPQKGETIEKFS